MPRLKVLFALSLLALVGTLAAVVYFLPQRQAGESSHALRIIRGRDEWVLQCNLDNSENATVAYTIAVSIDGARHTDTAALKPGDKYTYIRRIPNAELSGGKVDFALFRDDVTEPLTQATYYIPP